MSRYGLSPVGTASKGAGRNRFHKIVPSAVLNEDVPLTKSEQMRRVRSHDTLPELLVRKALCRYGVRYRLHRKDLPGKPDIYIPRLKLAVFVNGCFWHSHECRRGRPPSTNREFWSEKLQRNIRRDVKVTQLLKDAGIKVLVIWTCELSTLNDHVLRIARDYKAALNRGCGVNR